MGGGLPNHDLLVNFFMALVDPRGKQDAGLDGAVDGAGLL